MTAYIIPALWFSSLMATCGTACLAVLYFGTGQFRRFAVFTLAAVACGAACAAFGGA